MDSKIILISILFVLVLSGCSQAPTTPDDSSGGTGIRSLEDAEIAGTGNIIEMSASGFSPAVLTINKGELVKFNSIDGSQRWPASDIHPAHTSYPGSGSSKCGTSEEEQIFDACKLVGKYYFRFTEVGSWNYHDHKDPSKFGTIVVQ